MAQALSAESRQFVIDQIDDYYALTEPEQIAGAIKVIAKDFYIYCERNLCIKDKLTSQVVPFILNWAQKRLVNRVLKDLKAGKPVRYIILKARQMGLSTVIEALCYWWTTTHKFINSVIIAHKADASKNLYDMFRRYYENSHHTFQPDRKYNTKKDLVFDVEDNIKSQYNAEGKKPPGLSSQIKTMVAKEGAGRSDMINFFHGSEVAFWESGADIIASALQAVPLAPNTFVFLESTANGVGGYFYTEWQLAKKGESSFHPIFYAWHEHSEYEFEGSCDGVYDDEEKELLEIFAEKGYKKESWDRKILWRREKKKEFRSDPKKFYQEYPKDDMEAFLASGRPVFDIQQLVKMERVAEKAPAPMFGQVVPNDDIRSKDKFIFRQVPVIFQDQDPTPLKVWDLPEDDEKYTIGIDVSEGKIRENADKRENDYAVIDVMRKRDLKTVARWRGHIDPDLLGEVAYAIGTFYNNALIGVEVNNHGLTTVQSLRNKFYRNLYMREQSEEYQFQERTSLMGWRTDRKTKPIIINNMVHAIREGDILDLDVVFIRECMTYVRDDQGYTDAQEGMFDDTVMAKAINLKMADFASIDANYAKEHINKPIKRNRNGTSRTELEPGSYNGANKRKKVRRHNDTVARRRSARAAHRISRRPN